MAMAAYTPGVLRAAPLHASTGHWVPTCAHRVASPRVELHSRVVGGSGGTAWVAALAAAGAVRHARRGCVLRAIGQRGWFGRMRNLLKEELQEELQEERETGKKLRTRIQEGDKATEATLADLAAQLKELRVREAELRQQIQRAEEEEEESRKALGELKRRIAKAGTPNWRDMIEQQNAMLRRILEVAERLERREAKLRAELNERKANKARLEADLGAAAELSKV
mmetsp:Transcript_82396/g.191363  ORF Transcript_82396/g.191363 Transcript_82396/m.191363 type:complete len:225 (-) Transcript_82396:117-791(-)|eukprot:CAMPEP_0171099266 /NCGR_PEP_ID=MMETSP0766_2-20121228/50978_1 /TAXON_ID=439317 /ORGANISM="Gambierdiscus australes, Strain CAWD 149" /LENGTH=224 /DNA_ID=CAMNT_0011558845 /DNA_START=60 /DNA_END=734 /DNA_ORIENTATION=-